MIGKTIGRYQITSQLGKGGMGEVFQAKDQKLGRDVAIKVLPEEFAKDAARAARFQREAKVLASLNHPNIAAIYGLEESAGTNFLVLELVGGDTLADRIGGGPIPVEESLKLALQISEALEAAHEKGVIHRDLKPANIKVTPDGKVKILDFGLAKAFAGEQADLNLSNSPTLSNVATMQGVILGTAAYMSPEQARGKAVDKRTDIWAFGCVLFEMLTGQAAFQGEDVTEILAAVVKGGAKLELLPGSIHPRVREAITRCLQKDLKRRYSSITDARYEIEQSLADPNGVLMQPVTAAGPRSKLRMILPWVAAALALGVIIAGAAFWKFRPPEPHQVIRFDCEIPQGQKFTNEVSITPALAVSPDGKMFVYGTSNGLYLRSVDQSAAKIIAGTEGPAMQPFFSPDGRWIGYYSNSDHKLKKIAVNGGTPANLCDVVTPGGPRWNADDTILFSAPGIGIMRLAPSGGAPQIVIKEKSAFLSYPQILPDGKSVLFAARFQASQSKIMVQSLESTVAKELFSGAAPRYLPTGHLVYSTGNNNISAVRFDPEKLETAGGPVPIVEGVFEIFALQYAVSDSGTLVYLQRGDRDRASKLLWVDKNGKEEPVSDSCDDYLFPRISPDGSRVALTSGMPGNSDLWIWDLIRKSKLRLTSNATSGVALWTPDSKRIVYASEGYDKVCWKAANGTGKSEFLVSSVPGKRLYPWSWANNGKLLILENYDLGGNDDIGMVSMEGDRRWVPLLQGKHSERQPQVSPDSRFIAYVSDETGRKEIWVRPFPDVDGGWWQVSTNGGENPLWSPDGRELFYMNGDTVMTVPVKTDPGFSYETPRILFQGSYLSLSFKVVGTLWDISPDGKRFLMIKESQSVQARPKINVVLNWFEELKQRVPVN